MSDLELLERVKEVLEFHLRNSLMQGGAVPLLDQSFMSSAQILVELRIAEALEKLAAEGTLPPGRG